MNRLAGAPSAYLRQHTQDPVKWWPFGEQAFAHAREENRPIFLSIGYAACHWCHVMAAESFRDEATANFLNTNFVSIKVDREERPDVDAAYMAATQALSGQGGWPMSVFLTPTGKAFYAGTYFPPTPMGGRASFRQVLEAVVEAWRDRSDEVTATADSLFAALSEPSWQPPQAATVWPGCTLLAGQLAQAVEAFRQAEDSLHGGFGTAPKFPPTPALKFLIHYAAGSGPVAEQAYALAGRTLAAMTRSALFDQVSGGFCRYSVTADWSEPHYEKMLYDNGELLGVLLDWIRLAHKQNPSDNPFPVAEATRIAKAQAGFLLAQMQLPNGGFASSLDADTVENGKHHEGAYQQWTRVELEGAAKASPAIDAQDALHFARLSADLFNLPPVSSGPLRLTQAPSEEDLERITPMLVALREALSHRAPPARDEKVVASWNGQTMGALAQAATVLGDPRLLDAALATANHLLRHNIYKNRLYRVSSSDTSDPSDALAGSQPGIEGLLEDYAACADGFLTLFLHTGDAQWLNVATLLLERAKDFNQGGIWFNTVQLDAELSGAPQTSRYADPFDDATASPLAQLASALMRYSVLTGESESLKLAENLLEVVPDLVRISPRAGGGMFAAAQTLLDGPLEVVIVGPDSPAREALITEAWHCATPGAVVTFWDGIGLPASSIFAGRSLDERSDGSTAALAYVCRAQECSLPVTTPEELRELLG